MGVYIIADKSKELGKRLLSAAEKGDAAETKVMR